VTSTEHSAEEARVVRRRAEKAEADLIRPLSNSMRTTLIAAVLAVI
jgi:hypothetical protein